MFEIDKLVGSSSILSICRGLLLFFILLNIGSAFRHQTKGVLGYFILLFVMVFYCVFYTPQTGDNYTSMQTYYSYLAGTDREELHFENIYFYIMDLIPYGYVYYRLVLWGAACILCVWFLKKMEISSQVATLSVLSFALPILLYYQRAAFAYVLLYVALYCFISKGQLFESIPILKKYYLGISIIFLLCALPFHRVMPVYVAILLLSLFIPKNRLGFLILIVGLILFSISIESNSRYLLDLFQDETREVGEYYLENSTAIIGQNLNRLLAYYLRLLPIYGMIIYGLYVMIAKPSHLSAFEKVCVINSLILLVVSTQFMGDSFAIQIKFRNAAMMPWTFFLASYYNRYNGTIACSIYAIATIMTRII